MNKDIFNMTPGEAAMIIGNMIVAPDDCYSIAEYQWAKSLAIQVLMEKQKEIDEGGVSHGTSV